MFGHQLTYIVKHETKGKECCTEDEVIIMPEFVIPMSYLMGFVLFFRSLFVILSFFGHFLYIRLVMTPLASSNFSCRVWRAHFNKSSASIYGQTVSLSLPFCHMLLWGSVYTITYHRQYNIHKLKSL